MAGKIDQLELSVRDEDGLKIRHGDHITFTFGIPPITVLAKVSNSSEGLSITCLYPPDVKPKSESLASLMKWYQVWRASPARVAAFHKKYTTILPTGK